MQKLVIILGDGLIKHVNGWGVLEKFASNCNIYIYCKIYIKLFLGAKAKCEWLRAKVSSYIKT